MVGVGKRTDPNLGKDPLVDYMLKVREEHASKQDRDYSHVFRHKKRFDFLRLSAIIIGIEFAYAAETAFVSPILLQIGIDHKHMTMVWGLSPLLGFFLAPLLGSVSDRCQMKIGRRRPIITLLSAGILVGLLLVPYGRELGLLLGDAGDQIATSINATIANATAANATDIDLAGIEPESKGFSNYKFAVVLTVLGTILLDFDADTCQTPSRAYLLDVCVPADQPRALSTFTVMAGFGGTIGYALGGVDWESTRIGAFLGGNIPTVFTIVTIVFVLCYIITITSFREIPLKLIEKDPLLRPLSAAAIKQEKSKDNNPVYYIKETTSLELKIANMDLSKDTNMSREEIEDLAHSLSSSAEMGKMHKDLESDSSISAAGSDEDEERISLGQYLKSIVVMPKSMRILCLTNLLCWMAHLCYCLYFTDFVGEAVFGGSPTAEVGSEAYVLYDQGVRYGCWGLSIYAASCSIYSLTVESLMKVFGTRLVYIGGIMVYAIGMLILAIWPSKAGVLILSTTAGVIYATLFTMPYILVAAYHAKGCFKVKHGENVPLKQNRGLGTDIAIVSSMIFIAQLIVSLSIGSFITLLGSTSAVLYAASGLSLCAAVAAMFVLYIN